MALTKMFNDTDVNRFPYICIGYSGYVNAQVLAANVAEVHTIPSGANRVLFSSTANFYVKFGGTAAVPSTEVTDGSGSILNPTLRFCGGTTTIGLISPTTCVVTMEFYQ